MFFGSFVAMVTPFKLDGTIDTDAYLKLIDRQLAAGTDGIVPCGCTGQAATLTHAEQKFLIKLTVEHVRKRATVIAGTGSNSTKEAVDLTSYAKEVGADAALLIMPYYNKPTPAGQIAHFTTITEAVPDFPIVLYNVPGRTGRALEPQTVIKLAELPNIVALKEAGGNVDVVSQIVASGADIVVLSGDDSLTLPMMAVGATGVISVAANVLPEKVKKLCDLMRANQLKAARVLHLELFELFKALFIETNPIPVQATLAHMGLIENELRLPLVPITDQMFRQYLYPVLNKLGIPVVF